MLLIFVTTLTLEYILKFKMLNTSIKKLVSQGKHYIIPDSLSWFTV